MKIVLTANESATFFGEKQDVNILKGIYEALVETPIFNEKLIFETEKGKLVWKGKYKGSDRELMEVDYKKVLGVDINKDIGQQFVISDIYDPEISLVAVEGFAGSGKTFITLLGSLAVYSNVLYSREVVEVGRQLGYLTGNMDAKFAPYLLALNDNMDVIEKYAGRKFDGIVEASPMGFMRGSNVRGTSFIIDEAQNCTMELLKMGITRGCEGSIVILVGSHRQIDDPRLRADNSFMKVIEKFKGIDLFGYTQLETEHRSRLAKLADELL